MLSGTLGSIDLCRGCDPRCKPIETEGTARTEPMVAFARIWHVAHCLQRPPRSATEQGHRAVEVGGVGRHGYGGLECWLRGGQPRGDPECLGYHVVVEHQWNIDRSRHIPAVHDVVDEMGGDGERPGWRGTLNSGSTTSRRIASGSANAAIASSAAAS